MPPDLLPILLALLAAFLYALGAQFQDRGLAHLDSRSGAAITITTSAMLFILAAPVFLEPKYLMHPAALIFVLIGLVRPAVSANLALAGMRYLGPTITETLASIAPLFGAAMGVFLLGELLNWPTALSTGAIVAAIVLLAKRSRRMATDWPIWALALPIGAALIRSFAHVFTKVGMESIPDPYFAGLVGFVVSALVTLTIHKARRNAPPIPWRGPGARWFMGASCCFSMAVIALNMALHLGKVVQVIPVVAVSPIFILVLSVVIFRRERLTTRTVAAVLLVVPAVAVIAVAG